MTLGEYIETLQKVVADYPEAADLEVIYSVDDEGNAFHPITHEPTIGVKEGADFTQQVKANAVCIN